MNKIYINFNTFTSSTRPATILPFLYHLKNITVKFNEFHQFNKYFCFSKPISKLMQKHTIWDKYSCNVFNAKFVWNFHHFLMFIKHNYFGHSNFIFFPLNSSIYIWISFVISKYYYIHSKENIYTRKIIYKVSSHDVVYVVVEERQNGSPHRINNTHQNFTLTTIVMFVK